MNPLLCVIPYCAKDYKQTQALLDWCEELGGCEQHSCLLVADAAIAKDERIVLLTAAKKCFRHASTLPIVAKPVGFPPNRMFLGAAEHIYQTAKFPWLWLEPDCIPLKEGWLDALAVEYAASPKRFLGTHVTADQPGLPKVHLAGCAVYPADAFPLYNTMERIKTEIVAWDMEAANAVVPRSHHTALIQQFWGKRDLPPTFVDKKRTDLQYPENTLDLTFLTKEAVLFHRNKDGTLIRYLRDLRVKKKEMPAPLLTRVFGSKPAPVNP